MIVKQADVEKVQESALYHEEMRILLLAAALLPQDVTWHKSLQKGAQASARSGKPVLLVTIWNKGT